MRVASEKYVTTENISVRDAIVGFAMRAGSIPILFASIGNIPPTAFAMVIMISIEQQIVKATKGFWPSRKIIFKKFKMLSANPIENPILSSLNNIFQAFLGRISPIAIPRITRVADWAPELPPVPISRGR